MKQTIESDATSIKHFASLEMGFSETVFHARYSSQAGIQVQIHYTGDLLGLPNYYSYVKTNKPISVNLAFLEKKS